ncbi:chromosome associated protein G isoform X2 [Oratosquilla oratoria]|uniref:chromosome associated protein G isoform X2 n=1 Tax=Oratosquilla oratoria TaxID=337810 RepID=UPI003F75D8E8
MRPLSLKQAFLECQVKGASHPKIIKALLMTYRQSEPDEFLAEFTNLLKAPLIHGEKQLSVERTLNFAAKFACSKKTEEPDKGGGDSEELEEEEEEPDPFLNGLFGFLLNNHEANSQAVRFRVCQLINKILNYMGEEGTIDDDLYNDIYDTMLHRLQDKVPAVRVQAVLALARLQDPRNRECPVIKAYLYHLTMDPNPDVRRAVLNNIAITFQTLPDVLERTRDVRDVVRKQGYMVIAQRVHIRSLTIAQRVRIISEGLNDRSENVRLAVEKHVLQSWLRLVDGKVVDLLTCLDVEASTRNAELALNRLFVEVPYANLLEAFGDLGEQKLMNSNDLRPETSLYWKCLAQHFRKEEAEDCLEKILPELTPFCKYIHDYVMADVLDEGDPQETAVRMLEKDFVLQQLVGMTLLFDLSDEVGRRSLDNLVRTILICDRVGESVVKVLVEVFSKLYPPTSRINQLAEIISEVREPLVKTSERPLSNEEEHQKKIELAKVKVKVLEVREEIEDCVRTLDLERASMLKESLKVLMEQQELLDVSSMVTEEVQEERNDSPTLIKCLNIICEMVESPEVTVMNPTLHSLHENLVLPCLKSQDPAVRNISIKALGMLSLLSKDLAHKHLPLFLQISRIDVEQIQLTAMRCAFDILLLYGVDEFNNTAEEFQENEGSSLRPSQDLLLPEEMNNVISIMSQVLENESGEVRTVVAEGLCKLLLASRIVSSKLLTHLVLMWYNPTTEEDNLLRHMLGVFFPLYASFGGENQEALVKVVIPTLKTIYEAPSRSPLAEVDVDDVADFLVSITSPSIISSRVKDMVNYHDTLVFTLCAEVLALPDASWTRCLIRCLNHLELTPTNFTMLRQVQVLIQKIQKKVKERCLWSGVDRFKDKIETWLRDAPEDKAEVEPMDTEDQGGATDQDCTVNETCVSNGERMETTLQRRKRQLYCTQTDPEMIFSGCDSDYECSPGKKKYVSDRSLSDQDSADGIEKLVKSITFAEKVDKILTDQCGGENEVELTPTNEEERDGSPDLFKDNDTELPATKESLSTDEAGIENVNDLVSKSPQEQSGDEIGESESAATREDHEDLETENSVDEENSTERTASSKGYESSLDSTPSKLGRRPYKDSSPGSSCKNISKPAKIPKLLSTSEESSGQQSTRTSRSSKDSPVKPQLRFTRVTRGSQSSSSPDSLSSSGRSRRTVSTSSTSNSPIVETKLNTRTTTTAKGKNSTRTSANKDSPAAARKSDSEDASTVRSTRSSTSEDSLPVGRSTRRTSNDASLRNKSGSTDTPPVRTSKRLNKENVTELRATRSSRSSDSSQSGTRRSSRKAS